MSAMTALAWPPGDGGGMMHDRADRRCWTGIGRLVVPAHDDRRVPPRRRRRSSIMPPPSPGGPSGALVIADMPFLTYQLNADRLSAMPAGSAGGRRARGQAGRRTGCRRNRARLVEAGIPVMGHSHDSAIGAPARPGSDRSARRRGKPPAMIEDARALEQRLIRHRDRIHSASWPCESQRN